jgi:hypothetical protein
MATLRDVWPGIPIVPREYVDICFTLSSGICSGILVYFFADLLPRWMVQRKMVREANKEIKRFVSKSIERLQRCDVVFENDDGTIRNEESVQNDFAEKTYGHKQKGAQDDIIKVLLKIKSDREKLRMKSLWYREYILHASSWKFLECLTAEDERLFQQDLVYVRHAQEKVRGETVGIGSSIHCFYRKLKKVEKKMPLQKF